MRDHTHTASFGREVAHLRRQLGLTQGELAHLVGCSSSAIKKIEEERRRPSRQMAERLLDVLKVPEVGREQLLSLARSPGSGVSFPADRTLRPSGIGNPAHNLPAPPNSFVGRERELAAGARLLLRPGVRLLTLVGTPGIGKTRTALHLAASLLDNFKDGVFLVQLAALSGPEHVPGAMAKVLGLGEAPARPIVSILKEYIAGKEMLLVLDNFEHVLPASMAVAELLQASPGLKVLVTSRAPLHLYGEHELSIPPMATPKLPDRHTFPLAAGEVFEYEAVQLFVDRAIAVSADFELDEENAATVAAICQRVDGLPLAVELAAAHIREMPPQTLLARLQRVPGLGEGPLDLLSEGAINLPPRHQTLRAAVGWSYDLLQADEQALFRRLSVFAGGGTWEAVASVCLGGEDDTLDAKMASVTEKGLIVKVQTDKETRYSMLELIKEYALERLVESGEEDEIRGKHAAYYTSLVERTDPQIMGAGQALSLDRLEAEHNNLRAAMEWLLQVGDVTSQLRIAVALSRFWMIRGYITEGREWLAKGLARAQSTTSDGPTPMIANGLRRLAHLASYQGDDGTARTLCLEALPLFRALGDKQGTAGVLNILGFIATDEGDFNRARSFLEESLSIARELEDKPATGIVLNNLSLVLKGQGDSAGASALIKQSLAIWEQSGDRVAIAGSLHNLGSLARHQGDNTLARSYFERSLALRRELGDKKGVAGALAHLGGIAIDQEDFARARDPLVECLVLSEELGDKNGSIGAVVGSARLLNAQGEPGRAVRLLAAASSYIPDTPASSFTRPSYERGLEDTRSRLDASSWQQAWDEGSTMSLQSAIACAVEWAVDERP